MATSGDYRFGSIWLVAFDPSVGTEIRKTRPALIISGTVFNQRRTKVTVLPFTSTQITNSKVTAAVVQVLPSSQNGLSTESILVCIEPMTFDKIRLVKKLGQLEEELVQKAQEILRRYLKL